MGEEQVIQTELDAWNWIAKFKEKITLLQLKVAEHKKINEDDTELIKILFRIWHNGEFPLYETKLDLSPDKSVENLLNFANVSVVETKSVNGIEFDISL